LSPEQILTPAQLDLVRAVQTERADVYLTGGAALSAFYLGHRISKDLDLFTDAPEAFGAFAELTRAAARAVGAEVRAGQGAFPHYRAMLVRKGEFLGLDLVVDTAPAVVDPRPTREGIRVDSLEDILANKLVTVTSRLELRDFVDLYCIDRHGPTIVEGVVWARRKDPSLTTESLAHRLASAPWDAPMPRMLAPLAVGDVRDRITAVARDLAKSAYPG
jgi:hypothetical protein